MSEVTMKCEMLSQHVLNATTLYGTLGKGSAIVDQAAEALCNSGDHPENYPLGGENREEKFVNTFMTFTKAGAQAGAVLGDAVMLPYDLLVGRGGLNCNADDTYNYFKENGLLMGPLALGTTVLASGAAEVAGIGAGAVVGTVDFPVNAGVQMPAQNWFVGHMNSFGHALATAVAAAVGFAFGAVLDVARLASLAVKYVLMGVFAVGAAVVGFIGASIRGIVNA